MPTGSTTRPSASGEAPPKCSSPQPVRGAGNCQASARIVAIPATELQESEGERASARVAFATTSTTTAKATAVG